MNKIILTLIIIVIVIISGVLVWQQLQTDDITTSYCENDNDCDLTLGCGCQIKGTQCDIDWMDPKQLGPNDGCFCENKVCVFRETETGNWQSYRTMGNFSFKYPAEWELKTEPVVNFPDTEELKLTESYSLVPDVLTSLDDGFISMRIHVFSTSLKAVESSLLTSLQWTKIESQDIYINGMTGLYYITEVPERGMSIDPGEDNSLQKAEYYLFHNQGYTIFFALPDIQESPQGKMMHDVVYTLVK